jgi:hypothetical protein
MMQRDRSSDAKRAKYEHCRKLKSNEFGNRESCFAITRFPMYWTAPETNLM